MLQADLIPLILQSYKKWKVAFASLVFKVSEDQSGQSPLPAIVALSEQLAVILVIYSNEENYPGAFGRWVTPWEQGERENEGLHVSEQLPCSGTWSFLRIWCFAPSRLMGLQRVVAQPDCVPLGLIPGWSPSIPLLAPKRSLCPSCAFTPKSYGCFKMNFVSKLYFSCPDKNLSL